jgi:hypothetical protein
METFEQSRLDFVVNYVDSKNFSDSAVLASMSFGNIDEKMLFIVYSKDESIYSHGEYISALMYEVDFSVNPEPNAIYAMVRIKDEPILLGLGDDDLFDIDENVFPIAGKHLESYPRLDVFYSFLYTKSVGDIDIIRKRAYEHTRKILQQTL